MSTDPLDNPLESKLNDPLKAIISSQLWGKAKDESERNDILHTYFDFYGSQVVVAKNLAGSSVCTHKELITIILFLRSQGDTARKDIGPSLLATIDTANQYSLTDVNAVLDVAVRIMFMISCRRTKYEFTTAHIFRPIWKNNESLQELLKRSLPQSGIEPSDKARLIRVQSLKGRHLRQYANFRFIWTNNLLDHLLIEVKDTYKTLRIFKNMGFLEASAMALEGQDPTLSIEQSLALGCLPPSLVTETIRTIQLLFPENDDESRKFLAKAIEEEGLDHRFTGPYRLPQDFEEYAGEAALPGYVQELFEQFPHWGERLYRILREVEDPTPLTWYERWSDRKKNPRYTYWAGVIALVFALLFGILATILGALQVWISYCSWQGEAGGRLCASHSAITPANKTLPG